MKYSFSFILLKCIQTIMQLAASVQRGLYWDSERQTVSAFHSPIPTFSEIRKKKKKRWSDQLDQNFAQHQIIPIYFHNPILLEIQSWGLSGCFRYCRLYWSQWAVMGEKKAATKGARHQSQLESITSAT